MLIIIWRFNSLRSRCQHDIYAYTMYTILLTNAGTYWYYIVISEYTIDGSHRGRTYYVYWINIMTLVFPVGPGKGLPPLGCSIWVTVICGEFCSTLIGVLIYFLIGHMICKYFLNINVFVLKTLNKEYLYHKVNMHLKRKI